MTECIEKKSEQEAWAALANDSSQARVLRSPRLMQLAWKSVMQHLQQSQPNTLLCYSD